MRKKCNKYNVLVPCSANTSWTNINNSWIWTECFRSLAWYPNIGIGVSVLFSVLSDSPVCIMKSSTLFQVPLHAMALDLPIWWTVASHVFRDGKWTQLSCASLHGTSIHRPHMYTPTVWVVLCSVYHKYQKSTVFNNMCILCSKSFAKPKTGAISADCDIL